MTTISTPAPFTPLDEPLVGLAILHGVGVVTIGAPTVREHLASVIRERLGAIADDCGGRVAVSFSDVREPSATFLTDLADLHRRCARRGGKVVLFGLSEPLHETLRAAGLFETLPVEETLTGALARFDRAEPRKPHQGLWSRLIGRRAA